MSNAVDFSNPEALEAELKELEANKPAEGAVKAPKEKKPKMVTCPECGHVFELPKSLSNRGAVVGIPLEEMTEEQLKIEYRNASSVLYKTQKAAKDGKQVREGGIAAAQTRVDNVKAAMDAKGIAPSARGAQKVDASTVANMIASGALSVDDIQAMLEQLQAAAQPAEQTETPEVTE